GYAVIGHFIVKRECAQIVLEGGDASCVDHLDAKSTRCGECPCHIVAHCVRALAAMQEAEQKIVISEHRQRCFVDDWNVSQFKMRLHGVMRQHCGLNDCRKT